MDILEDISTPWILSALRKLESTLFVISSLVFLFDSLALIG